MLVVLSSLGHVVKMMTQRCRVGFLMMFVPGWHAIVLNFFSGMRSLLFDHRDIVACNNPLDMQFPVFLTRNFRVDRRLQAMTLPVQKLLE